MLPKSKYSPNSFKRDQSPSKKRKTTSPMENRNMDEIIDLTKITIQDDDDDVIVIEDDDPSDLEEQDGMNRVKLVLVDNHHNFRKSNHCDEENLTNWLSGKLRGKFRRSVSLKFDSYYKMSIGAMKRPFDVKISYNHKLIFVSDYGSSALFVFDLITKRYLMKLAITNPHYIAIESNIDYREGNENDAIIVTCENNYIYKIDIKSSVKKQSKSEIWKVGGKKHFNSPCGVVVYHNKEDNRRDSNNEKSYYRLKQQERDENIIMICDFNNNRIQVLGSKFGNLISSILVIPGLLQAPWMIDVNSFGDLVVSEHSNRVQLIRYVSNVYDYVDMEESEDMDREGWVSVLQFPSASNTKSKCCGIVVDKTTQNVIVCDRDSNNIRIFNVNGVFIKEVHGLVNKPRGICIDERSGELLIVDSARNSVYVFGHVN